MPALRDRAFVQRAIARLTRGAAAGQENNDSAKCECQPQKKRIGTREDRRVDLQAQAHEGRKQHGDRTGLRHIGNTEAEIIRAKGRINSSGVQGLEAVQLGPAIVKPTAVKLPPRPAIGSLDPLVHVASLVVSAIGPRRKDERADRREVGSVCP